jgi:alpha-tubulin suppressor-like RCC1 family protein
VRILALVAVAGCRFGFGETDPKPDAGAAIDAAAPSCTIEALSANAESTCAVTSDHEMFCWGDNSHGELGLGDNVNRLVPTKVPLSNVMAVSGGVEHTICALLGDGTVWCAGANAANELTTGTTADGPSPTQIMASAGMPLTDVIEVAVGELHACARRTDGLWCWGSDVFGQIGDQMPQLSVAFPFHVLASVEGMLSSFGHTCAWIGSDHQLECWGDNDAGQLGLGNTNTPVLPPTLNGVANVTGGASAYQHTCVALGDGGIQCWGANDSGQLGDSSTMSRPTPAPVLTMAGPAFGEAAEVGAGDTDTCARQTDGSVWCWGGSSDGQTGVGTNGATFVPTLVNTSQAAKLLAVGNSHVCVALGDGRSIQCWGRNANGALGNNSLFNSTVPTDVQTICP